MTHPIDKWCEDQGVTRDELARRANTSRQTLWRLVRAEGNFSTSTLEDIQRATGGQVTAVDLLSWISTIRGREGDEVVNPS